MLQIACPYCGLRAETEFHCGGEGGLVRPTNSESMDDRQWGDYVFMRKNPKGRHHEQWCHDAGCGRWFNAVRDTQSYRIVATYRIDENPPDVFGSESR
ncbi:MAG: sarcosine oxidase subunit delta [Burkholderiaceae bacterium]